MHSPKPHKANLRQTHPLARPPKYYSPYYYTVLSYFLVLCYNFSLRLAAKLPTPSVNSTRIAANPTAAYPKSTWRRLISYC